MKPGVMLLLGVITIAGIVGRWEFSQVSVDTCLYVIYVFTHAMRALRLQNRSFREED